MNLASRKPPPPLTDTILVCVYAYVCVFSVLFELVVRLCRLRFSGTERNMLTQRTQNQPKSMWYVPVQTKRA